ncbi:MAG: hypothetical protein IT381_29995 [Deltaproteobacteria bacterium]|nr:hypothetical protein [Deltaproteobacteria bacterium]
MTTAALNSLDQLLRAPGDFMRALDGRGHQRVATRTAFVTILVCGAIFGGAVGFYRGGLQTLYAAVKFPAVLLLTVALVTPLLSAIKVALGSTLELAKDTALLLSAVAMSSVIMAAASPLIVLAYSYAIAYHEAVLMVVGCGLAGGLGGVFCVFKGLERFDYGQKATVIFTMLVAFMLVGTQLAWTARPFLLRPKAEAPVFFRATEGSFLESVTTSIRSSQGDYRIDSE